MCGQSELDQEVSDVDVSQDRMLTHVDVPHGLKLLVNRVGETVIYGDQVVPGETVRFEYEGGSGEGVRNVLVVKVDDDGLEGLTLERDGEYRRYSDSNISIKTDILIVEPFVKIESPDNVRHTEKRVRFDDAVDALMASLSGEALAALYLTHVALLGDDATFDAKTGEVVVKLPEPKVNKFIPGDGGAEFSVQNKKGEKLRFFNLGGNEPFGMDKVTKDGINVNIPSSEWTPEHLRDELVKFLA